MKAKILFFSLCLISFQAIAQKSMISSGWVSLPIVADGVAVEWEQPFNLFDSDSEIYYRIANDSTNLYLCFQISDIDEQMKIITSGMQISLASKGTKKREASIGFPLVDNNQTVMADPQLSINEKPDLVSIRENLKLNKTLMEIQGFSTPDGLASINLKNTINVGIDWSNNDTMYYEVSIPFKEFFGVDYISKDLLSVITLNVKIKAIKEPENNGGNELSTNPGGGMNSGEGMAPGGGGMMPGGGNGGGMMSGEGMGGGGRGSLNGSFRSGEGLPVNRMFTAQKFKQKFILTIKQ
jgi:hypothetical protein